MTNPGAENTGRATAAVFAAGMSQAHVAQAEQTAVFVAGLAASGLSGQVLEAGAAAQQASQDAAAAWQRASTELGAQGQVSEAYGANPGAGTREFHMDQAAAAVPAGSTQPSATAGSDPPRTREPAADPLKVGGRIMLRDGEQFAGSGSVKNDDGMMVLAAAVDTPAGRQIHLGVPVDAEDKKQWRGGHAPAQQTTVDEEDGEEYQVDTGADTTVVLGAADAARLPAAVEGVIARAAEVDKECRQVGKECDRLYDERARLEARRFGDETTGEKKIAVDARVMQEEKTQESRRQDIDRAVDRLSPADRAIYDERQRTIDAAGKDSWEPDRNGEAAAVCGLTVDEFEEMKRLERIRYRERTSAQNSRLEELAHGGGDALHPVLPPLLAAQAALVCGLTVDEYHEMEHLEAIPKPAKSSYYNTGRRTRTDAEQARLDELDASPGGATGANQRETYDLRGAYLSMLKCHHSAKSDLAAARQDQAALEATAQPLDPQTAAELQRVTAQLDEANRKHDAMAGWASATAEIPAHNGGALVVEAVQREEGGVDYRVDRKPADAAADWGPGDRGDPYSTTAGGLRKVAKLAADLAGQPGPAGRPAAAQAFPDRPAPQPGHGEPAANIATAGPIERRTAPAPRR